MKTCGKKAFKGEGATVKYIGLVQAQREVQLYAYRCNKCGNWHMSSKTQNEVDSTRVRVKNGKISAAASGLKKAAKQREKAEERNINFKNNNLNN